MGTIFDMLAYILQIYLLVLFARVLLSWFPNLDYSNPAVRLVYDLTEPVLAPIRRAIPPTSGIDWSTMIAIVVIQITATILRSL
jgi:YggT family protein